MRVEKPTSPDQTAWQRLAAATASSSSAFACSYGPSMPMRTAAGAVVRPVPEPASAPAWSSRASSMLCRAISSWALADRASASSG